MRTRVTLVRIYRRFPVIQGRFIAPDMKELVLKYSDPEGKDHEVIFEGASLIIGRHSECGLVIVDSSLSREHAKFEYSNGIFTLMDLGSSNGTTLNGKKVRDPVEIRDGDEIVLGGTVRISLSLVGDEAAEPEIHEETETRPPEQPLPEPVTQDKQMRLAFILAPLIGLVLLATLFVGAILLLGDTKGPSREPDNEGPYESETADSPMDSGTVRATESVSNSGDLVTPIGNPAESPDAGPTGNETTGNTPAEEGTDRKTEALVYSFMKRIAKNDLRPYLTSPRFQEVLVRINRFRGSKSLAVNIRNAASNSAQISAAAKSKNLQPQFLAVAALARFGNNQGNIPAAASEMSPVLDRLTIALGNEMADDLLLVIAAYNEGAAGETLKMRNRLASLAKNNPTASSREIRTIWFLKDKGEISSAQYEFAVNFLAIGTITQNPKVFGVNSEALRLD